MKDKIIESCAFCNENEAEEDIYDEEDNHLRICEVCNLDLNFQEMPIEKELKFEEKLALLEKYFGDKVMVKAMTNTFSKAELEVWIDSNMETIINKAENKNVLAGEF